MNSIKAPLTIAFASLLLPCSGMSRSDSDPSRKAAGNAEDSSARRTIRFEAPADESADLTAALQAAFDSDAARVIIPNREKPYIVGPLRIEKGDKEIILEEGVVLQAKPNAFKEIKECLLRIDHAKNVTLRGKGATLRMNRMEYRNAEHKPSEWRHGIGIYGCENILVEDVRVEETGGDGVMISGGVYPHPPYPEGSVKAPQGWKGRVIPGSRNVTIRRVVADRNHRQGLSLISGENILIEDCVFSNTSGTRPSNGLDIEPSMPYNLLKNIVVRNCISEANDGGGFMVYLRKMKDHSDPVDVLIENCEVRGGKGTGLAVAAVGDNGVDAKVTFRNCKVRDVEKAGIYVYDKSYKKGIVRFENCHVSNVATSEEAGPSSPEAPVEPNELRPPPQAPVVLYLRRQPDLTEHFGGVVFENCVIEDDEDRPLVTQGARTGATTIAISEVHGTIITSKPNPVLNLGENTSNVTLTVSSK